ncbi:hypothetical protein B0H34DRAFT_784834 [Crassisporium funariophilum]|nr:hypothetical protein B0H34DRAFT_784834 [Crassisporium funariophilum]
MQCQLDPFDTVVFACLVCLFYSASHIGKLTVCRLDSFNNQVHVLPQCPQQDQDRNGKRVTVLHLHCTKSAPDGKEVYWSAQNSLTNPKVALNHHLAINQPPEDGHLFAYKHKNGLRPLTKTTFAMACWQSDVFMLYLWKHTLIMAPYIQAEALHTYNNFVHLTMSAAVR